MKFNNTNKTQYVDQVFSRVHEKYDLMNDVLSFGVHRLWKDELIQWMNPVEESSLIDVAAGTGDLALKFNKITNGKSSIFCVEPNEKMLAVGKKKLLNYQNIVWHRYYAEKLKFKDDTFDYYTISFGIRNVSNIPNALREALRVLKTGGRFLCLEFSKIDNEILNYFYQKYSKIIPLMGKIISKDFGAYEYLTRSIEQFDNQNQFKKKMQDAGFKQIEARTLSFGIATIYSGWKY